MKNNYKVYPLFLILAICFVSTSKLANSQINQTSNDSIKLNDKIDSNMLVSTYKVSKIRMKSHSKAIKAFDNKKYKRSSRLNQKALTCTHKNNYVSYNNFMASIAKRKKYNQADSLATKSEMLFSNDTILYNHFLVKLVLNQNDGGIHYRSSIKDKNISPSFSYNSGLLSWRLGKSSEAISEFKRDLLKTNNPRSGYMISKIYFEKSLYNLALEYCSFSKIKKNAKLSLLQGGIYNELYDFKLAEKKYKRTWRNGGLSEGAIGAGYIKLNQHKLNSAERYFKKVINRTNDEKDFAYAGLACVLIEKNNVNSLALAKKHLKNGLYKKDSLLVFQFATGVINASENKIKEAKENFNNCILLDSTCNAAKINTAILMYRLQQYDSSRIVFESVDIRSFNFYSYYILGRIFLMRDDYRLAWQSFGKSLSKCDNSSEGLFVRASIFFELQDYGRSTKYFLKLLKKSKEDLNASLNLANVYVASKDYMRALKIYNKILIKNNKNSEALSGKGLCFYLMKDYSQAELCFKSAIAYDSINGDYLSNLGNCYLQYAKISEGEDKLRFFRLAAETYQKAINLGYSFALVNLGNVYYHQGNKNLAYKTWIESKKIGGLNNCAYIDFQEKYIDEAKEKLDTVIQYSRQQIYLQNHAFLNNRKMGWRWRKINEFSLVVLYTPQLFKELPARDRFEYNLFKPKIPSTPIIEDFLILKQDIPDSLNNRLVENKEQ